MPDENELGTVGDRVGRGGLLRPELPRVVASERLGVSPGDHREVQCRIDESLSVGDVLRIHGEPRRQRASSLSGDGAEDVEVGPRTLRVDVIGGHRRDTAPVIDARIEQHTEVVGQVWRRLQVDVGGKREPGSRDRPEVVVARTGLLAAHHGAWFGEEVLADHFLHVTMAMV